MSREHFTRQREEERRYSRAVKVKGGTTVYLAGIANGDAFGNAPEGDFKTQARAAFNGIRETIELAGGTMDDIVTMTVFITDPRYGNEFLEVRAEYFKLGHFPASALITVSPLCYPNYQVEIQAIAVLDE